MNKMVHRQRSVGSSQDKSRESAGESVTDEATWQGDTVKSFKQRMTEPISIFLKGYPGCPEEQGLQGGKAGDRKVLQSWYSSAESFDGGLNQDDSKEDGETSTNLRETWEDELLDLVMDWLWKGREELGTGAKDDSQRWGTQGSRFGAENDEISHWTCSV